MFNSRLDKIPKVPKMSQMVHRPGNASFLAFLSFFFPFQPFPKFIDHSFYPFLIFKVSNFHPPNMWIKLFTFFKADNTVRKNKSNSKGSKSIIPDYTQLLRLQNSITETKSPTRILDSASKYPSLKKACIKRYQNVPIEELLYKGV